MDDIEKLLKELTEASGVPGYEREARDVIRRYFQKFGEITQDKIGSNLSQLTAVAFITDQASIRMTGEH